MTPAHVLIALGLFITGTSGLLLWHWAMTSRISQLGQPQRLEGDDDVKNDRRDGD